MLCDPVEVIALLVENETEPEAAPYVYVPPIEAVKL